MKAKHTHTHTQSQQHWIYDIFYETSEPLWIKDEANVYTVHTYVLKMLYDDKKWKILK